MSLNFFFQFCLWSLLCTESRRRIRREQQKVERLKQCSRVETTCQLQTLFSTSQLISMTLNTHTPLFWMISGLLSLNIHVQDLHHLTVLTVTYLPCGLAVLLIILYLKALNIWPKLKYFIFSPLYIVDIYFPLVFKGNTKPGVFWEFVVYFWYSRVLWDMSICCHISYGLNL